MDLLKIVVFAVAAAILVLRLRSILGRRTGHQRGPGDGFLPGAPKKMTGDDVGGPENIVSLPNRTGAPEDDDGDNFATQEGVADFKHEAKVDPEQSAKLARALERLSRADPNFNIGIFEAGSTAAFEIIVDSFAGGDKETLRPLLSDEVFDNFSTAIADRQAQDHTLETTLAGVRSATIVDADLDGRTAFVTVQFVSEQINVTRDSEDRIVAGDPTEIANVTDIWTFSRNIKSRNPNWILVGTDGSN
ncbi:MAG: Tim44/TimA family putative adaptor protein [Alphaproteobacteria bacterium]|nr:Tim44/TimA family putative adaptor protein [Alphaproteobacteria bacterium]